MWHCDPKSCSGYRGAEAAIDLSSGVVGMAGTIGSTGVANVHRYRISGLSKSREDSILVFMVYNSHRCARVSYSSDLCSINYSQHKCILQDSDSIPSQILYCLDSGSKKTL